MAVGHVALHSGRHGAVLARAEDRGRDVDLADPPARVVRAERVTGLDHHAPVVTPHFGRHPRGHAPRSRRPERQEGNRRRVRGDARRAREPEHPRLVRDARTRIRHEPGRGRAQHEAGDEVAVPSPQAAARPGRPSSSRPRSPGRCRARRASPRSRRRNPRAGRCARVRRPRPWPRRSGATMLKNSLSGSNAWNQFRPPLAPQPCRRSNVGAPAGPATSRTNVVPRPGRTMRRPCGSRGPASSAGSKPGCAPTVAATPAWWHREAARHPQSRRNVTQSTR